MFSSGFVTNVHPCHDDQMSGRICCPQRNKIATSFPFFPGLGSHRDCVLWLIILVHRGVLFPTDKEHGSSGETPPMVPRGLLTTVETELRWCFSSRQLGSCLPLGLAPHMPQEFSLWCPYPYSVPPNPSACISHHEFSAAPSYTLLKCMRSREYSLVAMTRCPES